MKSRFYKLMLAVLLLRVLFILFSGLTNDEAYYWLWSNHLQLSYYDHPPATAYILKFFTLLLGNSAFSIHFTALFFSTIFIFTVFLWGKELFDERVAFLGAATLLLTPLFFIGGTVLSPDVILGFFWMLTVISVHRALKSDKRFYWYLAGVFAGLGALTKYIMFFVPAGVFLWLIFSQKDSVWLKRKEPYISFIIMVLMFLPVIAWNEKNGWNSFSFHLVSRHSPGFSILRLIKFSVTQLFHISPVAYAACWGSFYYLFKKGIAAGRDRTCGYLFFMSFPLVAGFTVLSLFVEVLSHWPAYGYAATIMALPAILKKESKLLKINLLISIVISAVFVIQVFYPLIRIRKDATDDLYGWKKVAGEVNRIKAQMPPDSFIMCERYEIGGQLSFYTGQDVWITRNNVTPWIDAGKLAGKDAIYVNNSRYPAEPRFVCHAKRFNLIKKIDVFRANRVIRTFNVYRCEDFIGLKKKKK